MSEPVFFAVVKRNGTESARLFFDLVPADLLRKNSPLVYCTRIDRLMTAQQLMQARLADLFALFKALRAAGKLPVEDRGLKPKAEAAAADDGGNHAIARS